MTPEPIKNKTIRCPYCGEKIVCNIDTSIAEQQYIEDCQVCCAPIVFEVRINPFSDRLEVTVRRDNE